MSAIDLKFIPDYVTAAIHFYDKNAKRNRWAYLVIKAIQLVMTSCVTVVSLIPNPHIRGNQSLIVGCLGAFLLSLEGIQQTLQLQPLWVKYRATLNVLQRELMLYQSDAGPYAEPIADGRTASRLFAERAEAVIASENTDWTSLQEKVMAGQIKR
jgi:hypothetical protein